MPKLKKYIVEGWFRSEEIYDDKDKAQADYKRKKEGTHYKDVKIIELTQK